MWVVFRCELIGKSPFFDFKLFLMLKEIAELSIWSSLVLTPYRGQAEKVAI
jgi:hypothetical protein